MVSSNKTEDQEFYKHDLDFQYFNTILSSSRDTISLSTMKSWDWDKLVGRKLHDTYINFSTSNYLGLSQNEKVLKAMTEALQIYGIGSNGSPVLSGSYDKHAELERRIAEFHGTEAALVTSSGFTANLSTLESICLKGDVVFIEKNSHGSLFYSLRKIGVKTIIFNQEKLDLLERSIERYAGRRKFIVTCGVFSMSGYVAKIDKLSDLAERYDARFVVDDAHGLGTVGVSGKGVRQLFNLPADAIDIHLGTLSKAIGIAGGYIASSHKTIEIIRTTALPYLLSASIPPACAAAASVAIQLIEENGRVLVEPIRRNMSLLKDGLQKLNLNFDGGEASILCLKPNSESLVISLANYLFNEGILAHAIVPPGVQKGNELVRLNLTNMHTPEQIQFLLVTLEKWLCIKKK